MRQFIRFIFILLVSATLANAQTQFYNRDTTNAIGGFGSVNSAVKIYTKTGKQETAFEWGLLSLLDNYADSGENVAIYGQSNAHSNGPIWGACFEIDDDTGYSGPQVITEFTGNFTGKDSGLRLGVDIPLGDGKYWRGKGPSQFVEGTIGVRVVGASTPTTEKSWGIGVDIRGVRQAGVHIEGNKKYMPDAIIVDGDLDTIISAYGTRATSFMQIPSQGSVFTFLQPKALIGSIKIVIDGNTYLIPVYSP